MKALLKLFTKPAIATTVTARELATVRSNAAAMVRELKESGYTSGVDYKRYVWQVTATDKELLAVLSY